MIYAKTMLVYDIISRIKQIIKGDSYEQNNL